MRSALTGLTPRGRTFLAVGLAMVAGAVLVGQGDLLRVGVFAAALPLVAAWVVSRNRYQLTCDRRVEPVRVPVGSDAEVTLRLTNIGRLPTGLLLVEDQVPYVLGSRPRFVLDRVQSRGWREVSYRVRSDVRGRYHLGPVSLRLTDPFGLCEMQRAFSTRDTVTVTPHVEALPVVHIGGDWSGNGASRQRSVASAGEDDVTTREYRHGDPLHRVHWRSTARYGEIMVRREEQPWQSRCALLLDTRAAAHSGSGPTSSFEWAVSAAASIGVHLSARGFGVRLLTVAGTATTTGGPDLEQVEGGGEGLLLDTLAVVAPSHERGLVGASGLLRRGGGDGLLIAVLGALEPDEVQVLARLRQGSSTAVAVLLDTASWVPWSPRAQTEHQTAYDGTVTLLRRSGWRVVTASRGDLLPDLWPTAGHPALDPAGSAS